MSDLSTSFSRRSRPVPARRRSLLGLLRDLAALRRQRLDLSRLDDRALEDIGVTRSEARTEAHRPTWDAPHHWMR